MKIPSKVVPVLFVLLLAAVFLLGRYQGQVELLKGGTTGQALPAQTGGSQQLGSQIGQTGETVGAPAATLTDDQWNDLLSTVAATKGDDSASVTMVEFTDYQCPFCSRHFNDTQPQIESEYISTGKVKYVVRDFPLPFHGNAHEAAQVARCAGDQGSYWEMHDVLFEKQQDWSNGDPTDTFVSYAGDLGLDSGSFSSFLSSEKYKAAVDADIKAAQQYGVSGTPGFFVNGKLLVGAQPFSAFQQAIDAEI